MPHHAYYIEGSLSQFDAYKEAIKPYYAREYERFGIDEALELQSLASLKNYTDGIFLLTAATLTTEAQQALLKLFEEPQAGTVFIVMVPHGVLLPTVRSRMMEWPTEQQIVVTPQHLAQKKVLGSPASSRKGSSGPDYFSGQAAASFLKLSGKERSEFITKLLKDDEGQKERVRDLLDALEAELHTKVGEPRVRQALADIAMTRDYVRDRSPSLKMLLEHLALALPTG